MSRVSADGVNVFVIVGQFNRRMMDGGTVS